MELWQTDVVGGFLLADGRRAKALTGVDDHSRFCVPAYLTLRETPQRVCDGLALGWLRSSHWSRSETGGEARHRDS